VSPSSPHPPARPRRILLIGLDAADPELLLEGIEAGALPTLARLQREGAWGRASSPPGFGSGAVWPCFSTGCSPARHGRYFYRQVAPGAYEAEGFDAATFGARTVWEHLSDAGRRVAVFDVPKAGLSAGLDGLDVVDWLVHGPVYKELRTWPASLGDELAQRFGVDPLPQCDLPGGRDAEQHAALLRIFEERIRTKEAASRHYFASEPWSLFVTVFADPHCVGHQCWHLRDLRHPLHDPEAAARVGDPVLAVYRAIDAAIGRMLEDVDDDTVAMVVSCTGMGPNYTGNYLLDEMLRRLEGRRRTVGLDAWARLKRRAKRVLPVAVRKRGRRLSRRVEERVAHADREQRRCFAVPHNDIAGAIRVNLVGREPSGRVRPDEVPELFARLRRELLAVRNLDTGEPVVEDVVRTADHCHGERLDDLPDFFVLWRRDAPIDRAGSPAIGEVEYVHRGNRTGDHTPENLFFASGPGVRAGEVPAVSILDFAPTIAAVAGAPLEDCDGTPIPALVDRAKQRQSA